MNKHTPGPWHVSNDTADECPFVGDNDCNPLFRAEFSGEEAEANARLIAAAPELLEALKILIDQAEEKYPHFESERGQKNIGMAMLAVSKAEGNNL